MGIFLAGCNRLIITSGPTYTSRLWCCVELFTYTQMLVDDPTRGPPTLIIIGDCVEGAAVRRAWRMFDAGACQCFATCDKQRMMAHIESLSGGIDTFNRCVR